MHLGKLEISGVQRSIALEQLRLTKPVRVGCGDGSGSSTGGRESEKEGFEEHCIEKGGFGLDECIDEWSRRQA